MPRPARKFKASRMTIDISDTTRAQLEKLRDTTEAQSATEVIHRAISIYGYLQTAMKNGKLIVEGEKGSKELVIPEFMWANHDNR